eukprot:4904116-Pyramimonas_sp.AAC.1
MGSDGCPCNSGPSREDVTPGSGEGRRRLHAHLTVSVCALPPCLCVRSPPCAVLAPPPLCGEKLLP